MTLIRRVQFTFSMVMQLPGTYVLIAPFELPTSVPRPRTLQIFSAIMRVWRGSVDVDDCRVLWDSAYI